jgi:hypothetical protein
MRRTPNICQRAKRTTSSTIRKRYLPNWREVHPPTPTPQFLDSTPNSEYVRYQLRVHPKVQILRIALRSASRDNVIYRSYSPDISSLSLKERRGFTQDNQCLQTQDLEFSGCSYTSSQITVLGFLYSSPFWLPVLTEGRESS